MSTFITRLDSKGSGPRLAVKDLIDVEGVPTTAGSRALERKAGPAAKDAPCMAGARAADARVVGKTNLHELAVLPLGTNPWFGTPVNPFDPALIPGGSSSGSAVAVANDDADVAFGSDTGGSVRCPSACCGVTGLKTTHGRISTEGVWPLSPSLDTIGPLAKKVDGVVLGMRLLEPGFAPGGSPARRIGRVRTDALPEIEEAIDEALRKAEFEVVPIDIDWDLGNMAFQTIFFTETWECDHELAEQDPDGIGEDTKAVLQMAEMFKPMIEQGRAQQQQWRDSLSKLFEDVELLALPTMPIFPPRIDAINNETLLQYVIDVSKFVSLFNAAGVPGLAQPVPARGSAIPASLQLIAPLNGEELLVATGAVVERAVTP